MLGAIVGSFLNVCIYRMPRNLSIVRPRSFCPQCKAMIPWYQNIPLVSFLLLRGRCSRCKRTISIRYFMTELASAFLWWFFWGRYGFSANFIVSVIFFSILIIVIITDFETGLIPDSISFSGMVAGLALSVWGHDQFPQAVWYQRLFLSLLGLLAGGGILYATGWLGKLVFRKDSMGGGDVKFLALMGAFLGPTKVLWVFLLAPFPALPFALWQRFIKKEETIPFGPFLALAGALLFIEGDVIIQYLFKLCGGPYA